MRRMASHRERRQPKLINKFLTFRKITAYYLVSRKMVHSAMVASIASRILTRTLTAVDPRTAIRGHVRQLHIIIMILIPMILFRQRRPQKKRWTRGRRNPLKRLDSSKEGPWSAPGDRRGA